MTSELKHKIALSGRILYLEGHGDLVFGHVSARTTHHSILMKASGLGLEEVTSANILELDFEGNKLRGEGRPHLELAMHFEIYKKRPDINVVIHTHPAAAIALSTYGKAFKLINHDALAFFENLAYFNKYPGLISTTQQGAELAEALGDCSAVILQNHGIVVAGSSIEEAVVMAVQLEHACQILLQAAQQPLEVSREHAEEWRPNIKNSIKRYQEIFDYLERKLKRHGLDLPSSS